MSGTVRLSLAEAERLCADAAARAGASPLVAEVLARSVVEAEAEGNPAVGLAHLLDYCAALREGRIDGWAEPETTRPAPAMILSDAKGGVPHPGFQRALPELVAAARTFGCAVFGGSNGFTCGALGHFVRPLAAEGLVGLAATNGPALITVEGAATPVYCTNPVAFAAPRGEGRPPLLFDQASSATAFVQMRKRAARGEELPPGWAVGPDGKPTTDAKEALRGALLAFGGSRGANIALMVEVLAAGMTGARWSLDAPSFTEGDRSPGTGLFVLALAPAFADPEFAARVEAQAERLGALGVHVPGRRMAEAAEAAARDGLLVDADVLDRIRSGG